MKKATFRDSRTIYLIKADAQCELPEDLMIEHLEDHRDGIGWSIAALAKKRFYVRRTLKPNDPNGDMFCEVEDRGESLLKAVKQLIAEGVSACEQLVLEEDDEEERYEWYKLPA